jgi:hypothetical protein
MGFAYRVCHSRGCCENLLRSSVLVGGSISLTVHVAARLQAVGVEMREEEGEEDDFREENLDEEVDD